MTTLERDLIPADEPARLAAVRRYDVLDAGGERAFDRITALAARLVGAPMAVVSVVDEDHVRFLSTYGVDGADVVARVPGLCSSAILQSEPWIVTDAASDDRTAANPLVAGDPGLRFYTGIPLTTPDGHNIGTLCVIDLEPRTIEERDVEVLRDLAALVMDELELRRSMRRTVERHEQLRREAEELADALQSSLLPAQAPVLPGMEIATRYLAGEQGLKVGGDFFDVFRLSSNDWGLVLGDVCGRGARPASLAALARWTIRAAAVHQFDPGDVLEDVNAVFLQDDADGDDHYCSAVFARLELDVCGAWLTVANGGHPPPILVRRSGKVERRATVGFPIGMFDRVDVVDDRVGLGPGDALVFYTDGITEARDAAGELFGDERLLEVLRGCTGAPAEAVADAVVDAARRFAGRELGDDVAMLVVRVPDDAGDDPLRRVSQATGVPVEHLRLPGYPHEG